MKPKIRCNPWSSMALASTLSGMISLPSMAEDFREPPAPNLPYPLVRDPEPQRYNLKVGRLMARFRASAAVEASDNISLADGGTDADLSFGPEIGVGFFWPITKANMLQLDMGVGYRWFLNHPSIQTMTVTPASRMDYWIYFDEGRINLHDNFSVQVDPTSRPDLSQGTGGDPSNFRRINNTSGFTAEWRPTRQSSVVGGYDYTLDRSLSDQFTSLDKDDHTFSGAYYYDLSPRFTVGLSSTYTLTYYQQGIQNDAIGYNLGPVFVVKPSEFLTIDASVNYSVTDFASTGQIADTSDFRGATGQVGIRHVINSRLSHQARASRGCNFGVGSNFYDILNVNYGFDARLNRLITLHAQTFYEHFRTSGPGSEIADRYGFSLATGWQLDRHWTMTTSYTYNLKDSNLPSHNYTQNRVSLQLTRQF